jgi:hypothetical protein
VVSAPGLEKVQPRSRQSHLLAIARLRLNLRSARTMSRETVSLEPAQLLE